jgi:probable F420-dependent oxidoreductase
LSNIRSMDLGRIGIWSSQLRDMREGVQDVARELEQLGYGALWIPNGPAQFERVRELLDASRRVVVATGIASIWTHPAPAAAAAHRELTGAHPGRFLLGLGVSHERTVNRDQPGRYSRPLARMREYLDALDSGPGQVPPGERVLAALGPRMLALARERSAGAHSYLVTVEHTRLTRDLLGPDRLLAAEQGVVLETDPVRARAIGRQHLSAYLQLPNYTNNWLRLGFTVEDLASGGSDRLVDGLVAWGTTDAILNRIAAHRQAGADHVCIQVLTEDRTVLPRSEWRALAAALLPGSVGR